MNLTSIINGAKNANNFISDQAEKLVNPLVNLGTKLPNKVKTFNRNYLLRNSLTDSLKTAGSKTRRTIDYVVGYGTVLGAGALALYGIEKIPGIHIQKPVFDFYQNNTDWAVGLTVGTLAAIAIGASAFAPRVRNVVGTAYDNVIKVIRDNKIASGISAAALIGGLSLGIYLGVTKDSSDTAEEPTQVVSPLETVSKASDALKPIDVDKLSQIDALATLIPLETPTPLPTSTPFPIQPTYTPVPAPTQLPTATPHPIAAVVPTATPYVKPTAIPTQAPTATPYVKPTAIPTQAPTAIPVPVPEGLQSLTDYFNDMIKSDYQLEFIGYTTKEGCNFGLFHLEENDKQH